MNDIINEAMLFIQSLFSNNTDGHDAAHTLRVYRNAMLLAACYPNADAEVIALASLLHDADDHKLFQTENNANARCFLNRYHIASEKVEQICNIINSVSFSKNKDRQPSSLEGMIVQDADRLDAIGAIGIARTFAFGGKHERSLDSSIDHFHEKLLLLKDRMNTSAAKDLATQRHAFMLQFLEEYRFETQP